jgi:uncharacterized protein
VRRKDREVTDKTDQQDIIDKSDVCHIAFAESNTPYIVTLNFGYRWAEKLVLYFHCAKVGRKLDLLRKNNTVCFSMDTDHSLKQGEYACGWSMGFRSIVGYGTLSIVNDAAEKKTGLDAIMDHYGFTGEKMYEEKNLGLTEVLRLEVTELSGKWKK